MSVEGETAGSGLAKAHGEPAKATGSEQAAGQESSRGNATRLASSLLMIGSVLLTLGVLEIGCRLLRGGPQLLVHWPNFAAVRMGISDQGSGACAYAYDATLGWVLPSNCKVSSLSTDAHGFRRTPDGAFTGRPAVLATGSSFTQGEEVADDEAWPAQLQSMIGRKVVNGGVSGYAFDQAVLYTERIVPEVKPRLVVIGFTPDDVRRSELAEAWSRQKPYFTVADGRLELRNVPVPGQLRASLPTLGRLLGWSALAEDITQRLGMQRGWYFDEVQGAPPGSGEEIACLLMKRLAGLGVPTMLLSQYSRGYAMADADGKARDRRTVAKVLGCAAEAGLIAFDLAEPLQVAMERHGVDALYRTDHHSVEGNRVVAQAIKDELVRQRLFPQ
ncbi:MAG: hypothetical protein AB7F22_22065 [Reyranella sp.]|uniref:hypothetical protein n=1 Tax=Reyranella sp. TaxID=1929291 RepID=UPI003D0BA307